MFTSNRFSKIIFLLCLTVLGTNVKADEQSEIHFSGNIYGTHTNLMPYKGYQDDLSITASAQDSDFPLLVFARLLSTNYHYLIDTIPNNTAYTNDSRLAFGLGVDLKLNDYFTLRLISEQVKNKLYDQSYNQPSYGVIYNQYIGFGYFDLNNYLESFYIPRISSKVDTFFKVQALRSFYITQSNESSNVVYPTLQLKAKYNDDSVFGVSGQNISAGVGYKFYQVLDKDSVSFLVEGHSILFQSHDFNGDWFQALAAIQWLIN